jgi:hypothetical protein
MALPITNDMKTIVPSPRGQVRAAAAASLPVLARIPDVSAPEPEPIAPPQPPETEDVDNKQAKDLPPQPEKSQQSERPATDQIGQNERPRERPRQQRLPQERTLRPAPKKAARDERRRKLPPTSYLLAGLMALLLIVIVVLLTRNNGSAPDSQQSPSWPAGNDSYADTDPQHNHELAPGEVGGMDLGSPHSHNPDDTAGIESQDSLPPNFGPQIEQTSDIPAPGVVRLNGTIDKPDLQAQQPSENGVYPTR